MFFVTLCNSILLGKRLSPERLRSQVEPDSEECIHVTGKKNHRRTVSGRGQGFRSPQGRLVAKDFRSKSREDDVEELRAVIHPLELVKFLLSKAAASSKRRNVCKATLIDIGKAHLGALVEGEQHVEWAPAVAS